MQENVRCAGDVLSDLGAIAGEHRKRVKAGESPEFVAAWSRAQPPDDLPMADRLLHRRGKSPASQTHPGHPTQAYSRRDSRLARIVREKTPQQLQFAYACERWRSFREVIRRTFGMTCRGLKTDLNAHAHVSLQKWPHLVRSFFHALSCTYSAA